MVPASIRNNLAVLRQRERLLTFVWGAACWFAVTLMLLFVCGLIDWLIDRQRDTPFGVRLGMFVVQGIAAAIGGLLFMLVPQIRRMSDSVVALWVEDKMPKFEHRLISAVQLNQPGAETEGMSPELIQVVTNEADRLTQRIGAFTPVADHRRFLWAASITAPLILLLAIPFAIWPSVCFALLGRQFLLPIEVPHSVNLESVSPKAWKKGESIPLQFRVRGAYGKEMIGRVYVTPEGDWSERYDLEYVAEADDGDGAIFGTYVPKSSAGKIVYSARLADGRTRSSYEMKLVPRPVVSGDAAWVRLPRHCGLKPARPDLSEDDRRYLEPQEPGKVVGIPGSSVRVQFEVDSLDHQGTLVLLAPDHFDPKRSDDENRLLEKDIQSLPMDIKTIKKRVGNSDVYADVIVAEKTFALAPRITGFRLIVKDENGFDNASPPRWSLTLIPEPRPHVALLRDTFSDASGLADFDLEGMPVRLGANIRIPYECSNKYGLGKAEVLYRLLKEQKSGEQPAEEEEWISSPLPEVPTPVAFGDVLSAVGADGNPIVVTTKKNHGLVSGEVVVLADIAGFSAANGIFVVKVLDAARFSLDGPRVSGKGEGGNWFWSGAFNPKTGVFRHTPFDERVEFHAVPSPNPEEILGRTLGGGRHFLNTTGLLDRKTGKALKLKSGDLVEVAIKVYAAHRVPAASTPFAISASRVVEVMVDADFRAWLKNLREEDARIKDLERRQKEIFGIK